MTDFDEKWFSPNSDGETVQVEMEVAEDGTLLTDSLHIFQNPIGLFTFMGNIPLPLGKLDDERDDGLYVFPTFKTPIEAFNYAKWCGYTSTTYLEISATEKFHVTAVVCQDTTTGSLYLPLLEAEKYRYGKIIKLDYKAINEYKALGLEDMIFWSLYETGMDSVAILISDYAQEADAMKAREVCYKKRSN